MIFKEMFVFERIDRITFLPIDELLNSPVSFRDRRLAKIYVLLTCIEEELTNSWLYDHETGRDGKKFDNVENMYEFILKDASDVFSMSLKTNSSPEQIENFLVKLCLRGLITKVKYHDDVR